MMNVFLTFDIEIWCDGWDDLDNAFPGSFDRYIYGRSARGDYALPKTLEILNKNGLRGVFFVEPLFATRFGQQHLDAIVKLIRDAGQEIQLHLHPEWTDEALTPIIDNCQTKRQHLSYYTLDEQSALIACGRQMLEAAGSGPIQAFRSGSFAVNRDTFKALQHNAILLDTSLNLCNAVSAPDMRADHSFLVPFLTQGVSTFPVTVFKDGFSKDRPAQVGACSFGEMRDALLSAYRGNVSNFVIVSHNFEMLKPGSAAPDWIVVKRFERLCAFLGQNQGIFVVRGFQDDLKLKSPGRLAPGLQPRASWLSTAQRYAEQIWRRLR
jgi:hypothetical protein